MKVSARGYRTIYRAALLLLVAAPAWAQEPDAFEGLVDERQLGAALQRTAPPVAGIAPLTSRLSFNNTRIELGERWIHDFSIDGGNKRNSVPGGELNFIFSDDIDQRMQFHSGGVTYGREQSAWVFQLRAMDRRRTVTTTRQEQGDLLGFRLDYSVTGECYLPGAPPGAYCTYTPGLATVDGGYDPDTLAPSGFVVSSRFGEVISQDVHESIQTEERFQRGEDVDGADLIGMQLDVLNAGFPTGPGSSNPSADRREYIQRRFVPSIARIDQTLQSSSREAAATRTTRAFVLPESNEWNRKLALMQLAAWILPSAPASVEAVPGAPNLSVSNNLFFALNNARVPDESFTIFQTGRASVQHSQTPPQSAAETPVAVYNGFWMGLSPVRDTTLGVRDQYIPIGDRISLEDPRFAQGGIGTPFGDLIDAGLTLFDTLDQSITEINFQNIDDLFIQVGLDVTSQEAVRRITTTESSKYRLVPHLSFNGNRTGGESVLRYYAGAIFADKTNPYIGADYSLGTESGWNAYARLDLYGEPDRDYYSELELRGSRTFTINPNRQITFGLGGVAALDRGESRNDGSGRLGIGEGDSRVDLVGRWREGPYDFTLRQRFAKPSGGDVNNSTTFGVSYASDNRFFVSGQVTPISDESAYLQGALEFNWRMGEDSGAPVLQVQFARARYDLGRTSQGENFTTSENMFGAAFQVRF